MLKKKKKTKKFEKKELVSNINNKLNGKRKKTNPQFDMDIEKERKNQVSSFISAL